MRLKKRYFLLLGLLGCGILVFIFIGNRTTYRAPSQAERLGSLSYLSWVAGREEDRKKEGVVGYRPEYSFKGFNLYTSSPRNSAFLLDEKGSVIHTWSKPHLWSLSQAKLSGDSLATALYRWTKGLRRDTWQDVVMDEDASLFFLVPEMMLGKLDRDSNLEWKVKLRFHHWIRLGQDGSVYSIVREMTEIPYKDATIPILNEFLVVLSPDGKIKEKISLFDSLGGEVPEDKFEEIVKTIARYGRPGAYIADSPFDVFHVNSVEVIDRDVRGICKRGDLLISVRQLNLVAIIDRDKGGLVWSWGKDELDGQHAATFLANGNILIFDNGRDRRDYSRVIEVDPLTRGIEWEYKAQPPQVFYTRSRGSAQKLPNGNVLITETESGRAFEVTRGKKRVWDFYNPDRNASGKRAAIFRMLRYEQELDSALR